MAFKKNIPFDFILDEIASLQPTVKPMFGAYAVYVEHKIVFILRHRESYVDDNGVWLATTIDHHESLQKIFPNMRSLGLFDCGVTAWQNLPMDSENFEEDVFKACEMVLQHDPRIGKVPKMKIKAKSQKKNQKKIKSIVKKKAKPQANKKVKATP